MQPLLTEIKLKNVAILLLGILVSQLSFAQRDWEFGQTEFKFGLKAASNLGFVTPGNKSISGDGVNLGFAYGIMGDFYFRPNYGLNVELLMSNANANLKVLNDQRFTGDTSGQTVTDLGYEYNLQYIEIPISIKFRTKEIGDLTYWGNLGFSPGFLLNAKANLTGTLPQYASDNDPVNFNVNEGEGDAFTTDNFDDKVFLFRFPLIIGGGVEYKLAGNTILQGGLRYSNSFTDMLVKDKTANAKNNYVALSVGILF